LLVEHQWLELHRAVDGATDRVPDVVARAVPVFTRADDQHGLCRVWRLQAWAEWTKARAAAAAAAWERAAEHAQRARVEHERAAILTWVASSIWFGPMPVEDGIRRCEQIREQVKGNPASEAELLRQIASLHSLAGRFDDARDLFAQSNTAFAELGIALNSVLSHAEAVAEMLAGNFTDAERRLRDGYEALAAMGENALRSTSAAFLSRAILEQGRSDEAERYAAASETLAEPDDLLTQMIWRGVRARILCERGRVADAETLAREAVALAKRTDLINFHADALLDLAHVFERAGEAADALECSVGALALYEQKGNLVSAQRTRAHLDALAMT
jgi:tetratricopeptide (TPR) repeat protein